MSVQSGEDALRGRLRRWLSVHDLPLLENKRCSFGFTAFETCAPRKSCSCAAEAGILWTRRRKVLHETRISSLALAAAGLGFGSGSVRPLGTAADGLPDQCRRRMGAGESGFHPWNRRFDRR